MSQELKDKLRAHSQRKAAEAWERRRAFCAPWIRDSAMARTNRLHEMVSGFNRNRAAFKAGDPAATPTWEYDLTMGMG